MSLGKELGFLPWRNLVCVWGGGVGNGKVRCVSGGVFLEHSPFLSSPSHRVLHVLALKVWSRDP